MSEQVLVVLISASAVVAGALIGFGATFLTTKLTVAQSHEQRRIERAQEMRAEVIPRLFVLLHNQEEQLASALDLPGRATERMREATGEYLEGRLTDEQADAQLEEWLQGPQSQQAAHKAQAKELIEYFLLHRIWLPEGLASAFAELADEYDKHWMKVHRAVAEWADRGSRKFTDSATGEEKPLDELAPKELKVLDEFLNQEKEFYEAQIRETRDWFEGERLRREAAMWSAAREVLGVEE